MRRHIRCLIAFALLLTIAFPAGVCADSYYDAVTLNVPDYKQFDGEWASLMVGKSGKTMKQIGCAITSLAMAESYRTGKAITPDVMKSRLTFNGTGALYWPGNYVIPSAISYRQLYDKLKNNIPVIVGAHYYQMADLLAVMEEGAGFYVSTRQLHGPGALETLISEMGADRLIFGSGAPLSAQGAALKRITSAGIAPEIRHAILGGNLRRLLGRVR